MNLLFIITSDYIEKLKTLLFSIKLNNIKEHIKTFLIVEEENTFKKTDNLKEFCKLLNIEISFIRVPEKIFFNAPVSKRYPRMVYYRLIAQDFLPKNLKRILYLDCDILCINSLKNFYNLNFENNYYIAADHHINKNLKISAAFNNIRLGNYGGKNYFNSGVLLMNLVKLRKQGNLKKISDFINKNNFQLFFPDQDILNGLYGNRIKPTKDIYYNYETKFFSIYKFFSSGTIDLNWVINNTVFLHFCGKEKPWFKLYKGKFSALYKHYQHLVKRIDQIVKRINQINTK